MRETDNILCFDNINDSNKCFGEATLEDDRFTIKNLGDIFPSVPIASPTFRANYFSFVFIKHGKGSYSLDEYDFQYEDYTLYFSNPGHLKSFDFETLDEGYVIKFDEKFLKENVNLNVFTEFPFLLSEIVSPQVLSAKLFAEYETLYLQILNEFQSEVDNKYKIIGNLFVALLYKIKNQFWKDYYPLEDGNRSSQIIKKFKQDLEKQSANLNLNSIAKIRQVSDYASAQGLNTNYFNQVIKSKTGKPASVWIAEKTLLSAKILLKNPTHSIKKVAYTLGFSEVSHFSGFFKRQTGFSPSAYQKQFKR